MTTDNEELSQIRAILKAVAESQARTQTIADSNACAIEANSAAIAELREFLRQSHEQSRQRLEETTADVVAMIVDIGEQQAETSNQIDALLSGQHENRREHREFRSAMREMLQEIRRIWQRLAG